MNLVKKYKLYRERLKADREAFESSLTSSVHKQENTKQEAANTTVNNTVLTSSASLSQPTSPAKSNVNAQTQNETASHTMRQAVPPSPSMMAKKAIMMPATSTAQIRALPPGAILMKGPPPSGAKIMMHNPAAVAPQAATVALSSTTSVAASRPISPRVPSANTSQTMLHGNPTPAQGTPPTNAQRLASPPLQRTTPSNNSFMMKTPMLAPLSSAQVQQQQRLSPPGVQMVKLPPSPAHARLSTSQANIHPPPQVQTGVKMPVPPPPPHLNTQKLAMGVANMRPNVVQPPNVSGTHKLALPTPPPPPFASGKMAVKAPPITPASPQRIASGAAQTQLGAVMNNKNNNNSNTPPTLSPAILQAATQGNASSATLMSKNASFARNQQSPGNSTSSIPMNATTHALSSNHTGQNTTSTPPPAPLRNGVNSINGQSVIAKATQPIKMNTSATNELLERETSTPMFLENDELSEIQFHVEPTPQAVSTLSDVRSDKADEIKFEELKVEFPSKKTEVVNNSNSSSNTTSLPKDEEEKNTDRIKKTNSYSVSASHHPRSSSESSASFVEETVAPRHGESDDRGKIPSQKSKLHEVANTNTELQEIKPLERTSKPSTSRRKISVRRRRRRHSSKNNNESDTSDGGDENNEKKNRKYEKEHHKKDRESDANSKDSDSNFTQDRKRKEHLRSRDNAKHKSNSVVTEIYNDNNNNVEVDDDDYDYDYAENGKQSKEFRHSRNGRTRSRENSHLSNAKNEKGDNKALHTNGMSEIKSKRKLSRTKNNVHSTRKLSSSSSTSSETSSSESESSSQSNKLQARRKSNKKNHHHSHRNDSSNGNVRRRRSLSASSAEATKMTAAKLDPRFDASQLKETPLTSSLRTRIAEQFLSILCPQQYYGIVKKIHGIRPIHADKRRAAALHRGSSILVATKGTEPNRYFYPQLRLDDVDGEYGIDTNNKEHEKANDAIDTPIILYEATPGTMLFANNELEAARLLEANDNDSDDGEDDNENDALTRANKEQTHKTESTTHRSNKHNKSYTRKATSCFVVSRAAILFRQPECNVVPIAQLNVRWVPYASPSSEPQCAIHKKEMQLFAPESKELVCALCAHKSGINTEELIVIPDVIKTHSRRRLFELLQRQLEKATHMTNDFVNQHQRLAKLKCNQQEAIDQQFDLLRAALESKRKEFHEAAETEYSYAMSEVARHILSTDEKVQLLQAASTHLHGDITKPLYSMQIATIAEGLEAMRDKTLHLSKAQLQQQREQELLEQDDEYKYNRTGTAPLTSRTYNYAMPSLTHLTPNLEKVMLELQSISATSAEMSARRQTQNRKKSNRTAKNIIPETNAFTQNANTYVNFTSPSSMSPYVSSPVYPAHESRSRTAPLRRSFTSPLLPRRARNTTTSKNKNDIDWDVSFISEKEENEEEDAFRCNWPAHRTPVSSTNNRIGGNSYGSRVEDMSNRRERAKSHSAWEKRNRIKSLSWHSDTYSNNAHMTNAHAFRTLDDALASYKERSSLAQGSLQQQRRRRQENGKLNNENSARQRLSRSAPERPLEDYYNEEEEEQERFANSLLSENKHDNFNSTHDNYNERSSSNYRKMLSSPCVVVKALGDVDHSLYRFPDERTAYNTSTVPNSSGTFLFDFPIHELFNSGSATFTDSNESYSSRDMLGEFDNRYRNGNGINSGANGRMSPSTRRTATQQRRFTKERVVRWHVRVDDAGDWVGIGVGVGCPLSQWIQTNQNDFSHLWIVPQLSNAQTFVLEVCVRRGINHAKLTVYDLLGKQLDEGNIPQWNANRPSYPQVTFGGRTGVVRIVEPPHLI